MDRFIESLLLAPDRTKIRLVLGDGQGFLKRREHDASWPGPPAARRRKGRGRDDDFLGMRLTETP
jgi:hypothetical protein